MPLSRRDFLKLGTASFISAPFLRSSWRQPEDVRPDWQAGVQLGRMTESRIRLYSRPNPDGQVLAFKYRDEVVTIVREVVGRGFYSHNHVWFETPEGYAYSSWAQPVRFAPHEPVVAVPTEGVYVEVSVPFTDAHAQPDPGSPVLYRLYYGTTYQAVARLTALDGTAWYQLNDENVVKMYALSEHLRPVAPEEFEPLAPGIPEKSIVVTLREQMLTAYEGRRGVFRARISSRRNFFGPDGTTAGSLTPAGEHPLWQKRASRHTLAPRWRAAQVQV